MSETRTYNNDNTLASISFSGAAIGNLTYGWDDNKNKTSEAISGTMSGYGFDVGASGYDDEDRLVNWERADSALDQSWDLSLVGDWDSITENSATQNRTHGPTHELLTVASQSVTHDLKGNITSIPAVLRPGTDPLAMAWDFDNRLVSADVDDDSTADVFYKWDALGRRVYRDDGTTAQVFVQSGQQTIADYTATTAASSPTYTYVYASYIDEPVMRGGSGGLRYYHRDQQYSVTALTDGGGTITERYAYSAYGTPTITDAAGTIRTSSADNNRYTYTGREFDEVLGLYHYRARMYDSIAGRFCSRDPIGFNGSRWNLYEYGKGRPHKVVDPLGLTDGLVQLPVVAHCVSDQDIIDYGNRTDPINQWKSHNFYTQYINTNDLVSKLQELVKGQKCPACIADLDINAHSSPWSASGITMTNNFLNAAPPTDVRWLSQVDFCDDCVIYLSGCNTGLRGAPLAKSLANATGCHVRGTKGYSYGSPNTSATIPNPWYPVDFHTGENDPVNGTGPHCTSYSDPGWGHPWHAPYEGSCSAGSQEMWVDIYPD